jgi:peptide/nickel transport system substrate-binding protein
MLEALRPRRLFPEVLPMILPRIYRALCAIALALLALPQARAADLTIALGTDVTSLDPHYHNLTPNNNVAQHVYGLLVERNEKEQLQPGLATEWKAIDPTTWEFKLRRGVKFHDGSDFTADDVIASLNRVPKVPNSPSPFTAYTKQIVKTEVVDPYTVRLKTATPYPLMPSDLTQVFIVSRKAENASTDDFNSGKAAIGTGPYKLVRYAKGDRIELARFEGYWGGRTPWDKVTMRLLPQAAARVAALLAGDVQVIEAVPTSDIARLKQDKRIALFRTVVDRLIYLHLDSNRDASPFVTDKEGNALTRNPLKDARVRHALSLAIDRDAIVARVMEGEAVPSGQLVPDFLFGASRNLKPDKYDPAAAKKLLVEAGWPDGFGLTLHTPNDRYANDSKIAQTVAQMWTRAGIPTKVVAMPSATYFPQATELKFSTMLLGWSTGTGEASSSLKALIMTFNKDKGFGGTNRGRYSNPKVDAFTEDALQTVDDIKREAYLQRATEILIADQGIIPVHFQINTWAARDGITYTPRVDETTLAWKMLPRGARDETVARK